jgi:biotin synthase
VEVVCLAREAGLETCCGGIFGMGESWDQRLELILTLKDLEVDAMPINFLNPIPGTRLADLPLLDPFECLKIIALSRLLVPEKSLIICGGREVNLGELQDQVFLAGADSLMIGDYLTTKGRSAAADLQMLKDKGLEPGPP